MATKVHMEALSPTMEEGQLVRWLKSEGDAISEGDVLAEIETDKATMEVEAVDEGVIEAILVEAGMKPMETLQAATRNPARFLGREKELGTVQKGRLADLVEQVAAAALNRNS